MKLVGYLVPIFPLADLRPMLAIAFLAALVSGCYGILHDQITYTISPEYFSKLKFDQFSFANFGLGERWFVATIGFLATWWAGLIAGWFLARRLLPQRRRTNAYRQIALGIAIMLICTAAFGCGAYIYGLWPGPDADLSSWEWVLEQAHIDDRIAFVRVAYIHNAGYVGAAVGLLVAIATIRPQRPNAANHDKNR